MSIPVDLSKMTEDDLVGLSVDDLTRLSYRELAQLQTLIGKNQERRIDIDTGRLLHPQSARERLASEVRKRIKIV